MSKEKISLSRRSLLVAGAAAVPLVSIPIFKARAEGLEGVDLNSYKPVFFSAPEWRFIVAACDRLIPAEGKGPGALATNVPVFIDQQLHNGLGDDIYMQGPHPVDFAPTLGFQNTHGPQDITASVSAWHSKPASKSMASSSNCWVLPTRTRC